MEPADTLEALVAELGIETIEEEIEDPVADPVPRADRPNFPRDSAPKEEIGEEGDLEPISPFPNLGKDMKEILIDENITSLRLEDCTYRSQGVDFIRPNYWKGKERFTSIKNGAVILRPTDAPHTFIQTRQNPTMDIVIADWTNSGIIEENNDICDAFPLFAIPKANRGIRIIQEMSSMTPFVHTEEFSLKTAGAAALVGSGLRKTDPRLAQVMKLLDNFSREPQRENDGSTSPLSARLNPEVFKEIISPSVRLISQAFTNQLIVWVCYRIISPNVRLISQAFTNQLIVPDFTEFCDQIKMFYDKCKTNQDGKVASYIPQLAKMTPSYWGVSVCTIDGQRCSFGDTNIPFTLQSCSKPLTYAITLEELGNEKVHTYVGQKPSGRMFNELVLDSQTSQLEETLLRIILFSLVVISSHDFLITDKRVHIIPILLQHSVEGGTSTPSRNEENDDHEVMAVRSTAALDRMTYFNRLSIL
uniref:glutaminase n=1 Tax=Timema cristinae TaxID=61476 RepID=A0A7R9D7I2_TIMCR|nr:unnamed protein product [Timema cristinae]